MNIDLLRKSLLVCCLLKAFLLLEAQSPTHPTMPKLTPSSPEAAAMNRYGEYPVSLFTGVPDISIPIFEIKSGKFTVPVTLSYHPSGIKVNDYATWAGLGWSISAGGRVSRKVMGKDDQTHVRNVRNASTLDPMNESDHLYLQQIANQTDDWDSEPDIYIYSFPGKSGRFIFGDAPTYLPVMIPYCGVKVAGKNSPNLLTDESGSIYTFGQTDNPTTEYPDKWGQDPISSWILTKMVDAGRTDSVQLTYQSVGYGVLGQDFVDYIKVDDQLEYSGGTCGKQYTSGISSSYSYAITTMGSELVPSQISFSHGIIKFIPSTSNRLDRSSFKSLDRIEIYSLNDLITPMRVIKFYMGYFDNNTTKRLRLDSLKILDKVGESIQKYKFEYYTGVQLPDMNSKDKDLWGYYNGKNNDLLLPRMTIYFDGDNSAPSVPVTIGSSHPDGKEPDPNYMKAYVLNKITYPTGGYTTFEYETNRYNDGQTNKYAGGLRIYKIRSYDENGIATTKTYKYGVGETGLGRFNVYLSDFYYQTPEIISKARYCTCEGDIQYKRSRTYTSNPCTDLSPYDGSPVVYSSVTEYAGDETNNTGKIIHTYTDDSDALQNCGQGVGPYKICRGFRRGLLESKTVYRNDSGIYKKVFYLNNQYFKFPNQYVYLGIKVYQIKQYDCAIWPTDRYEYTACNVPVYFGDRLLTSSSEYQYDLNDENKYIVKTTSFDYNNTQYAQVTSTTTTSSSNDQLKTTYKYANDFDYFPYTDMTAKNIIGMPIQETELINQTDTLYSKKIIYNKYSKLFAPEIIKDKISTNPFEIRIRYYNYDSRGNLLSAAQEDNFKLTYIWGYNKNFLVAKIENASLQEVQAALGGSIPDLGIGGLSSSHLNALHSGLPNALITSYTYDFLDGLRSQTDPNRISTFYDYDNFGRLRLIKDHDGHILKTYEYHYGQ